LCPPNSARHGFGYRSQTACQGQQFGTISLAPHCHIAACTGARQPACNSPRCFQNLYCKHSVQGPRARDRGSHYWEMGPQSDGSPQGIATLEWWLVRQADRFTMTAQATQPARQEPIRAQARTEQGPRTGQWGPAARAPRPTLSGAEVIWVDSCRYRSGRHQIVSPMLDSSLSGRY
jgi:hypothetical protein